MSHPDANQEPPQNGALEIPNYNTFLAGDSELGEMPPEVNPVSSMPEDESQFQPEEPNQKPAPEGRRVKRERPVYMRKGNPSPSGDEEEEWVDEKEMRARKRVKHNEAPIRRGPKKQKGISCQCKEI